MHLETGFRIGADAEHITIADLHRPDPVGGEDEWDLDWMTSRIELRVRKIRGSVDANLRAEDFVRFRDALRPLYASLVGSAKLLTMEHNIELVVTGDGRGHFRVECLVRDGSMCEIRMQFPLEIDQTELGAVLRQLDVICESFPVLLGAKDKSPRSTK